MTSLDLAPLLALGRWSLAHRARLLEGVSGAPESLIEAVEESLLAAGLDGMGAVRLLAGAATFGVELTRRREAAR